MSTLQEGERGVSVFRSLLELPCSPLSHQPVSFCSDDLLWTERLQLFGLTVPMRELKVTTTLSGLMDYSRLFGRSALQREFRKQTHEIKKFGLKSLL